MSITQGQPAAQIVRPGESDWFSALHGSGGFGVVTAMELRLYPLTQVYAGLLWWPMHAAPRVLPAWRELTHSGVPDQFTTALRLTRFPALPEIPGPVRGRWFVVVSMVTTCSAAESDEILRPLRALAPSRDTIATIPAGELGQLQIAFGPSAPGVGDGLMLAGLPRDAVAELLRAAGPDTLSLLTTVELRHLARPGNGALAATDGEYALFAAGRAPTPAAASAVWMGARAVTSAMRPWSVPPAAL